MIPVANALHGYISLNTRKVDREDIRLHTRPASGLRLGFRGGVKDDDFHRWNRATWVGDDVTLDRDGRFKVDIDLGDKTKAIYMILHDRAVRLKEPDEGVFRVFGIHDLGLEEGKQTYDVEIVFQALLPQKFSGVVKNLAHREDISPTISYSAMLNGEIYDGGNAKCEDDGTFQISVLPLEGAEIEARVGGLRHIEFKSKTMSRDGVVLQEIMEQGLVIDVRERPPASLIFKVEIVDKNGNPVTFEQRRERAFFYIGFVKDGHDQQGIDYNWQDIGLWVSAGIDSVHLWNISSGKKKLVARHMMEPRKIIPDTVLIEDLDEKDRPQVIKFQIVHEQ